MMIPNLITALNSPLSELEHKLLETAPDIDSWFLQQWQQHHAPFYSSVDLRNSGFKLAPVDTNLFPGGFNNLNQTIQPQLIKAFQNELKEIYPQAQKLLLIPENHTRNTFYLQNVSRLLQALRQTGLSIRIGSLSDEISKTHLLQLPGGHTLELEPIQRTKNRIHLEDFDPDLILLNNDLSAGIPTLLEEIQDQPIFPPLHAGWSVRRKSNHFIAYRDVANRFAEFLAIDPWLINPYFGQCGEINFHERIGEECLASNVDHLLEKINAKYKEYAIEQKPFVVVKADAGTYGMGIMMVHDAAEIKDLNRKQRNKMAVIKEGLAVQQVILQEGIHTIESINQSAAEPVIYMVGRTVVGGFYRTHSDRGIDENLNAPGMQFIPMELANTQNVTAPNRFYQYGIVTQLAALAAAIELEHTLSSLAN